MTSVLGYIFRDSTLNLPVYPGDVYNPMGCTPSYFIDPYNYEMMSQFYFCDVMAVDDRIASMHITTERSLVVTVMYTFYDERIGDLIPILGLPTGQRQYDPNKLYFWRLAQATSKSGGAMSLFDKVAYVRLY
jgi:hypothetical protein